MKKYIYTSIVLAALAVGCTKSSLVEVPQYQETPIEFDVYNGKVPMTKAASIIGATGTPDLPGVSLADAGGFHVTAFKHQETTDETTGEPVSVYSADNLHFDKDITWSSDTWAPSTPVFWPATGSLDFVAYGKNALKTVTEKRNDVTTDYPTLVFDNASPYTQFTYTVPVAVADQEDLVVSKILSEKSLDDGTNVVSFEMKHVLSRIGFKVETKGSGTAVKIKEITLNGSFVNSGTVDLASDEEPRIIPSSNTNDVQTSYTLFTSGQSFEISPEEDGTYVIFDNSDIDYNETNEDVLNDAIYEAQATRYMMIMPGEVSNLSGDNKPSIHVVYEIGGVEKYKDFPLTADNTPEGTNMTFVGGYAYEYIFTISVAQIDFTGTVEPWDEDLDGDGQKDGDDDINVRP